MRVLDRVLCIYYPMQFRKDKGKDVLALLDSESEIDTMTLAYAAQLDLKVQKINVSAQKIDKFLLATYNIVIAAL